MATETTFEYKDVYCATGTIDGHDDVVVSVQFTYQATRGTNVVSNSYNYKYETPVFDDTNPYLAFADWKAQKLYPLLDSIVLVYKWKSDLNTKLDTLDLVLTSVPITETITPPVTTEPPTDTSGAGTDTGNTDTSNAGTGGTDTGTTPESTPSQTTPST